MRSIKFLVTTPKTGDNERAVLPTILYVGKRENWGHTKGRGFGIMIGWWAWSIGFMYVSAKENK